MQCAKFRIQTLSFDMNEEIIHNYLLRYAEKRLASGKLYLTLNDLRKEFASYSDSALTFSLNRLSKKGKIVSIHKGFYLIIPPDRMAKGILPPPLFVDSLMNYLNRVYYVGLLSASVYYGASHQQAQEYFLFINKPQLREKNKKGLKLNFVVKSDIPQIGVEKKKTEAGYINVSSAELTAIDLVKYQSKIGGINRVVSVISELVEEMKVSSLKNLLDNEIIGDASLQRLGYILDKLNESDLADVVFGSLSKKQLFKVPLKSDSNKNGFPLNKKWKIIENIELDLEF